MRATSAFESLISVQHKLKSLLHLLSWPLPYQKDKNECKKWVWRVWHRENWKFYLLIQNQKILWGVIIWKKLNMITTFSTKFSVNNTNLHKKPEEIPVASLKNSAWRVWHFFVTCVTCVKSLIIANALVLLKVCWKRKQKEINRKWVFPDFSVTINCVEVWLVPRL